MIALYNDVLKSIIGQDEPVKRIVGSIFRSINFKSIKTNMLIIGKSGSGKTETIRQIAAKLDIPYTIEDATKYTQEGYYGADVEEMIYNLIAVSEYDIPKAQHGIIIIDEIDKKVSDADHGVSGVAVLKSLLKIIEGSQVDISQLYLDDIFFETQDLIIVFLGAFDGLDKIRDKRLNKNQLGFIESVKNKEKKSCYIKKDLIEYGMPDEFVGRIDTIVEMNQLTQNDLSLILSESNLSIFRRYEREFASLGVILKYNLDIFDYIAVESLSLDTGARELNNTVNYMFEEIIFRIFAEPNKYKECIISKKTVHENWNYELI